MGGEEAQEGRLEKHLGNGSVSRWLWVMMGTREEKEAVGKRETEGHLQKSL